MSQEIENLKKTKHTHQLVKHRRRDNAGAFFILFFALSSFFTKKYYSFIW
jgi:hypothetical protein